MTQGIGGRSLRWSNLTMVIIIVLEPLKRVGDEVGRVVSLLLKVSGEPVKRSGTLKGTRSPPHAVDERGALNSMREER